MKGNRVSKSHDVHNATNVEVRVATWKTVVGVVAAIFVAGWTAFATIAEATEKQVVASAEPLKARLDTVEEKVAALDAGLKEELNAMKKDTGARLNRVDEKLDRVLETLAKIPQRK